MILIKCWEYKTRLDNIMSIIITSKNFQYTYIFM